MCAQRPGRKSLIRFKIFMVLGALASAASAASTACGPSATLMPPPPPSTEGTATVAPVAVAPPAATTLTDAAHASFVAAAQASDPRERCRLLVDATTLDASSIEGHLALAESRCAPAKELLAHARYVFEHDRGVPSATIFVTVAARAEAQNDALEGARALGELAGKDVDVLRLAAGTCARFGDHERAAQLFSRIVTERASSGSTSDALDARLDALMESIRAGGKGALVSPRAELVATIEAAVPLSTGYGGAWVGPKIVDAIATARTHGDGVGAAAASKLLDGKIKGESTARASSLERAIADARAGKPASLIALASAQKQASGVKLASSRVALAVLARVEGRCGDAMTYADGARAAAFGIYPRLEDDGAWAGACSDKSAATPSLLPPIVSPTLGDLTAVAGVDSLRGRSLLYAYVDAHPHDLAARIALAGVSSSVDALSTLDKALGEAPAVPALRIERLLRSPPDVQAAQAEKVLDSLRKTREGKDDPRAVAPVLVVLFERLSTSPASRDAALILARGLVESCVAPAAAERCLPDAQAASDAIALLREKDPSALAYYGPSLADADLAAVDVRLAIVGALVAKKEVAKAEAVAAPKRGAWTAVTAKIASALVAAGKGTCNAAKARIEEASKLPKYALPAPEKALIEARCP